MIRCPFCNAILRKRTFNTEDIPFIVSNLIRIVCVSGHNLQFDRKTKQVTEVDWYKNIPGRVTHLNIFDRESNQWNLTSIANTHIMHRLALFDKYSVQQAQRRLQLSFERNEWLLCALRLGIIKDLRILIAKYLNYEPFKFWK